MTIKIGLKRNKRESNVSSGKDGLLAIMMAIMCKENGWNFKVLGETDKKGLIVEFFPIQKEAKE